MKTETLPKNVVIIFSYWWKMFLLSQFLTSIIATFTHYIGIFIVIHFNAIQPSLNQVFSENMYHSSKSGDQCIRFYYCLVNPTGNVSICQCQHRDFSHSIVWLEQFLPHKNLLTLFCHMKWSEIQFWFLSVNDWNIFHPANLSNDMLVALLHMVEEAIQYKMFVIISMTFFIHQNRLRFTMLFIVISYLTFIQNTKLCVSIQNYSLQLM